MNTGFRLWPEAASTQATNVDNLFIFTIAVTAFFSILIFGCILVFAVKYRRRSPDEIPRPIHGSLRLEVLWSVIPLLISMVIFAWGADIYFTDYSPPPSAQEIYVVGKQWMWKLQHPEGRAEINELHIPVGQPVKLTIAAQDVIHSFYVPEFRIKKDAVPGHYSTIWLNPNRTGVFHLFCAEYCGTGHSAMIGKVYVMEPNEYQNWLSGSSGGSMSQQGAALFEQYGCVTCHLQNGQGRCPSLLNVYGHQVQLKSGGTVMADDAYVRESILNPSAKIVQGYENIMPTFQGQISEEGILQLIAYVRSLSTPARTGTAATSGPRQAGQPAGVAREGAPPTPRNPSSQPGVGRERNSNAK